MKNNSEITQFTIEDISTFKKKALYWANMFPTFCTLDNNDYKHYNYSSFEFVLAVDAINYLEDSCFDNFIM